jgi:hypothetical protein
VPRVIDFSTGNESEWGETRIADAPVYGTGEITAEEINAISKSLDDLVMGFEPQFSTYGKSISVTERGAAYEAAHAWLSANASGPWRWSELWTNHGHHLDIAVFVERLTDQLAFGAAQGHLFQYRAPENSAFAHLAVSRGVLPRLTTLESFTRWTRENSGFDILPADDLGDNGLRVTFSHAHLESEFDHAFGARFTIREDGGRRVYEGVFPRNNWRDSPVVWLSANSAVSSISANSKSGTYKYSVVAKYDDTAAALSRDWGHVFKPGEDQRHFSSEDYPYPPTRNVPADFMAYLTGDRETYEAPYLAEDLKAFRSER